MGFCQQLTFRVTPVQLHLHIRSLCLATHHECCCAPGILICKASVV